MDHADNESVANFWVVPLLGTLWALLAMSLSIWFIGLFLPPTAVGQNEPSLAARWLSYPVFLVPLFAIDRIWWRAVVVSYRAGTTSLDA